MTLLKLYVQLYIFQRRVSIVSIRLSEGLIMSSRLRFANVASERVSGILVEKLFLKPPKCFCVLQSHSQDTAL